MVVVPPLAAIVYLGVGRHPIAGMLTGYAGATLGYASNFLISGTDSLIAGITTASLQSISPGAVIDPLSNYYFKLASTLVLVVLFGCISTYLIEPRLGVYKGKALADGNKGEVTPEERKALKSAGIWTLLYIALIAVGIITGFVMNPETGGLIGSPLLQGIVPVLFLLFIISGLAYGKSIGALNSESDIQKALIRRMANMAPYIVMSFMAAQFIQLFTWSNLGALLSIGGAEGLASIGFTGLPLIICFIILTALLDFLIGSGSAKWTLMGPIFVPMLSLLGISPAFTQMAYRIGDSVSNVMSPTSAFLYMMLGEAQTKYDPDCTLGTFLSCQFLFFISSLIAWIVLVVFWVMLNLPLGPGYSVWL
jgi:aminobenzoyl-glutamate transport protein